MAFVQKRETKRNALLQKKQKSAHHQRSWSLNSAATTRFRRLDRFSSDAGLTITFVAPAATKRAWSLGSDSPLRNTTGGGASPAWE